MTKIALLVLLILIILSTSNGDRTKMLFFRGRLSRGDKKGICNSMVLPLGYPCQNHPVTTKDGFILGLQRIPTGISGNPSNKPPVLLQHGLMMDAGIWLLNQPDESLPFILADAGYDVWLANSRGTRSSRGHTSLNPKDKKFWDWTWDEQVTYDLPTTVQYVYNQTGQNLHYVGHSVGTLIALAALSKGENWLNMIRSTVLLSPIAYLSQMPSPLGRTAANNFVPERLYQLGFYKFYPKGGLVGKLLGKMCDKMGANCSNLMTSFTGKNCCLNSSRSGYFLEHEPQATSTKTMIHVCQMIRNGKIEMFRYKSDKVNLKHYGQINPPVYNMSRIRNDIPLYISYGGKDALSDVNGVKTLLASLKNHHPNKLVTQYLNNYAHADFVFGVNANKFVYYPLMAFIELN
ncbi:triacylglycerol lipase 2-like [Impatiens glandulifera]|uniref:triacylglycerol lipase 2-like n=1 Tax=Impatiens glandulifera TaxID=253017 RepID=UPI001FB15EE1|nr:triacylglycerol lipase 2-like [Impatiens glandulifera]